MNVLLDLPGRSQVVVTPLATALGTGAPSARMITVSTPCCGASAKGSANVESGVCCRACYAEIPAAYGWCAVDGESDGDIAAGLASVITEVFPNETVSHLLAVDAVQNLRGRA